MMDSEASEVIAQRLREEIKAVQDEIEKFDDDGSI